MAASSLLALIDDIATVLDDVALLTKVAAKKTAGVLGDDLALNAQQVSGVRAERELPVVWALAISALAPWAVTPLLMVGGAYLCFEGFEKLAHKVLHSPAEDSDRHAALAQALADPATDLVLVERDKIAGAVRTDFILSAEIIAITLGTVAQSPLLQQAVVVGGIAVVMTVGVYGFVAGIVKLDDLGLWLSGRRGAVSRATGRGLLHAAPWLMRGLSVAGTAAMFLVGGGILVHGVAALDHAIEALGAAAGAGAAGIVTVLADAVVGILAGALVLAGVTLWQRVRPKVEQL